MIENAAVICEKFPQEHRDLCINGSVDNVLNFDDNLKRVEKFCHLVEDGFKTHCFKRIGENLINLASNIDEIKETCNTLRKKKDVQSCLEGARVQTQ